MTTIRPTVTNSPPTPAENFTEGNDQDMSKLLEGLVLAWIPAASIGVLLILVGFLILVVKTISRRRRRKIIIKKKQTRDQVGVDSEKLINGYMFCYWECLYIGLELVHIYL